MASRLSENRGSAAVLVVSLAIGCVLAGCDTSVSSIGAGVADPRIGSAQMQMSLAVATRQLVRLQELGRQSSMVTRRQVPR